MDGNRFDTLTRRFGSRLTRREVVRGLVAGVVAVAAGPGLAGDADARCGADGVRCNRDAACCSGYCRWQTATHGRRRTRIGTCHQPCTEADGPCASDAACCSGICYEGACLPACKTWVPNSGMDAYIGCESDAACCSGSCGTDGFCKEALGQPCEAPWNCASDKCSDAGACIACFPLDHWCATDADCCQGACDQSTFVGTCKIPPS